MDSLFSSDFSHGCFCLILQTHISRLPPGTVPGQSLAIEGGVCRLTSVADWCFVSLHLGVWFKHFPHPKHTLQLCPYLSDALSVKKQPPAGYVTSFSHILPLAWTVCQTFPPTPRRTPTHTLTHLYISYDLRKQGERLFGTVEQMRLFSDASQTQYLVLSLRIPFRIADCMLFRQSRSSRELWVKHFRARRLSRTLGHPW